MAVDNEDPRGLKARLRRAGRTQTDLADYLGVDLNVVYRIASGQRKRLTEEESRAIEAFFMASEAAERRGAPGETDLKAMGSGAQVPLYGFAAAAMLGPIHLNHAEAAEYVARHPAQGLNASAFAVRVWGESMSPRYEPGEIAYCVRGQHPRPGQDVVVETKSGDAWLKTYRGQRDGQVRLEQLNPLPGEAEIQSLPLAEIAALHAVVGRG
jgi:phage repressor protein C with HTH and peptisase S24 domain